MAFGTEAVRLTAPVIAPVDQFLRNFVRISNRWGATAGFALDLGFFAHYDVAGDKRGGEERPARVGAEGASGDVGFDGGCVGEREEDRKDRGDQEEDDVGLHGGGLYERLESFLG